MAISTSSTDNKKDKPEDLPGPYGVLGYLERRAEQIMEKRQTIDRIAGAIRNTMLDIANLLAGGLSIGGQEELDRAVGNLQGLTKAVDQASVAAPNSDSSVSRGKDVDLTSIKAAVETHRDSANATSNPVASEGGLQNADDKRRGASMKAKILSALDAVTAVGEDKAPAKSSDANAPGDNKPLASDAPVSKADLFKQAFETGDNKADPSLSAKSARPLPATSSSARSSAALLKLDHAEATHTDPAGKADVSVPDAPATGSPKETPLKTGHDKLQTASVHRKPSALIVT